MRPHIIVASGIGVVGLLSITAALVAQPPWEKKYDKTGNSIVRNSKPGVTSAPISAPSSSDTDLSPGEVKTMEEQYETFADMIIATIQKANTALPDALFKRYGGLPTPVETDVTIQTYQQLATGVSGKNELLMLMTLSKATDDINTFSGELGVIDTIFYMCSTDTKTCERTTMIEDAVKAGQPGYVIGEGYSILGWDDLNKRIFSHNSGEGGDRSLFGQFGYDTKEAYTVGGPGYRSFGINPALTRFVMQRMDSTGTPTALEIYAVDNPTKPTAIIRLADGMRSSSGDEKGSVVLGWNRDGETAIVEYQGKKYTLNVITGEMVLTQQN